MTPLTPTNKVLKEAGRRIRIRSRRRKTRRSRRRKMRRSRRRKMRRRLTQPTVVATICFSFHLANAVSQSVTITRISIILVLLN